MELPGSSYLYALATIAITFAGFAALIVVFRQIIGGRLRPYDLFFVRAILMRNFIVVGCSMLPPMLALFELPQSVIWRASSVVAGLLQGAFALTWQRRRRAVTEVPVSPWMYLHNALQLLVALLMLAVGFGLLATPGPAPFAAGLTGFLFLSGTAYLMSLGFLLAGVSRRR